jgi:hypothetical protein
MINQTFNTTGKINIIALAEEFCIKCEQIESDKKYKKKYIITAEKETLKEFESYVKNTIDSSQFLKVNS